MREFFPPVVLFLLLILFSPPTEARALPTVAGSWVQLRKSPLFESETIPMAQTWGPSIPATSFQVEKVYGRWLFGTPIPLKKMKEKDFLPAGWIYSRMLLMPGDQNTDTSKYGTAILYYSQQARKKLGLASESWRKLDFLESLVLSERTLRAFLQQDQSPQAQAFFWEKAAYAAEESAEKTEKSFGLIGTDLGFLDQEFQAIQTKKKQQEHKRQMQILKMPKMPKLSQSIRTAILGRFMADKYLVFPELTHEEVDGTIYMRATALRSLRGCPKQVQDYWKGRRWHIFRTYGLKSRPEQKHPWLQVSLPGGYFFVSARALEVAGNEAEMAFLLVRSLVREMHLKKKTPSFSAKGWPASLHELSEIHWQDILKAESTKESDNLDVGDEIEIDMIATECISKAGYRPMAGPSYLRKLFLKKEEPWAKWFVDHSIGLSYRIDRFQQLLEEALKKHRFAEGKSTNIKRFTTASRYWNLLP